MAFVAVLIPMAMLAIVLALGRYEELMLPPAAEEPEPQDEALPVRRTTRPASPRPVGAADSARHG